MSAPHRGLLLIALTGSLSGEGATGEVDEVRYEDIVDSPYKLT